MKKIFIPLLVLLGVTLYPNDLSTQKILSIKKETIIHIVPLGNIDKKYPELVKTYIEDFYGFECVIDSTQPLTKDILASSGTRYEASKIITKFNSDKNTLLLTDVDIAIFDKEKNIKEYGIIGLGFRPGKTCVVSTFRIRRHVSENKMLDRLQKVSIHEVGHNLGLDHCDYDKKCMMNDVRGTIKQIDMEEVWFCHKCRKKIGMKNIPNL